MIELSVLGIVVRDDSKVPFLLLHPDDTRKCVALRISAAEAVAVSTALELGNAFCGSYPEIDGPALCFHSGLAHDVTLRLIRALGGRLLAAELVRIREKDQSAELILRSQSGIVRLKCRPVDAIILALRSGVAIRMGSWLLPQAENLDLLIDSFSERMRALITGKLADSLPENAAPQRDPSRQILSAARKILDQHLLHVDPAHLPAGQETRKPQPPRPRAPKIVIKRQGSPVEEPRSGRKTPHIHVALLRQQDGKDPELIDEYTLPAAHIPKELLAGLEKVSSTAAAVSGRQLSDEERWATMLRVLAPETKVLM